jgi:hypothetical protein
MIPQHRSRSKIQNSRFFERLLISATRASLLALLAADCAGYPENRAF